MLPLNIDSLHVNTLTHSYTSCSVHMMTGVCIPPAEPHFWDLQLHYTFQSKRELSLKLRLGRNAAKGNSTAPLTQCWRSLCERSGKQLRHCSSHQMSQCPRGSCDWRGTLSGGITPLLLEDHARVSGGGPRDEPRVNSTLLLDGLDSGFCLCVCNAPTHSTHTGL